jgi:hypothetical protein
VLDLELGAEIPDRGGMAAQGASPGIHRRSLLDQHLT